MTFYVTLSKHLTVMNVWLALNTKEISISSKTNYSPLIGYNKHCVVLISSFI